MKPISDVTKQISQAMSVKYNMAVYDLQQSGEDVIVLSLGEAFFKLPRYSFESLPFEKGYHYSSSLGLLGLREKIAKYYETEYKVSVSSKKEMLISSGSKIIIYMVLLSLLNPGEEVIILEPAWVSYVEQVRLCGGIPIMVPYDVKIDDLQKYFTEKTKCVIINNPNNPSGKVYSEEELKKIFTLADKNQTYILSDEAYSDFVDTEPFVSMGAIDKEKKLSFIVNSLSKCFGMSGWRVGYVIANEELMNNLLKINQHLVTCPVTLIEYYLDEYFDKIVPIVKPQLMEVVRQRAEIAKFMDSVGLIYLAGTGTFYFMVSVGNSSLDSENFSMELLKKYKVSTVPGIGYGDSVSRFVRVSVGTESLERIQKGLMCIKSLIEDTAV